MTLLLHEAVLAGIRNHPDRVAIVDEAGSTLTYRELGAEVSCWAGAVARATAGSPRENPFVGILAPVSPASIAAVLGVLVAGYTYVPLDEQAPTSRLRGVLVGTGMDLLIGEPTFLGRHPGLLDPPSRCRVLTTESVERATTGPPQTAQILSDDLAYVLHSSGSTGIPKGIMLTHRNARTFTDWMQKEFALTPDDVVMSRAPFKFDLSVFDIFNTLAAGARLVTFDWTSARDSETRHRDYVALMQRERATVLYTTPSTFIALMNRGGLAEAQVPLRTIMYAGEPFPTAQLRRLQSALPHTRIANIYGPTETNIITCHWVDSLPDDDSSIPLGREVDDTEIIVVSEDGDRLCTVDEVGELWCRGGTVTLGYLGMPEKTAEHLVVSPFHQAPAVFWRTGDYGFRDAAGVLHYRGRRDHMVKVRGYRVELGDIESALARHERIDEAVVVALPDTRNGTGTVLVCFFTALTSVEPSAASVQTFLQDAVPEYMVPRIIEPMSSLPKTSSGKVDRVLLAEHATVLNERDRSQPTVTATAATPQETQ